MVSVWWCIQLEENVIKPPGICKVHQSTNFELTMRVTTRRLHLPKPQEIVNCAKSCEINDVQATISRDALDAEKMRTKVTAIWQSW